MATDGEEEDYVVITRNMADNGEESDREEYGRLIYNEYQVEEERGRGRC